VVKIASSTPQGFWRNSYLTRAMTATSRPRRPLRVPASYNLLIAPNIVGNHINDFVSWLPQESYLIPGTSLSKKTSIRRSILAGTGIAP
jgi:hypothetical protein